MAHERRVGRVIAALFCVTLALCVAAQGATAADESELVFAGWGGTLGQALKSAVIPGFERQHGVKVVYLTQETVNMVARLKAQAARPQVDVVAGTDASHSIGRREGLFEKLDPATFRNFADLYPFAINADGVGVMFGIQALGLEYDTKVFQEKGWPAPSSWNDLWDPKFKGHVVVYNPPNGYAVTFLGLLAVLEGGSPAQLDPAWAKLPGLVPNALTFIDPAAQLDVLFSTGGAWLAFNGSGRIGALAATGVPVAMAVPKEGGALNPNYLDIVKGAPHPTLAHAFVEYMLSPEAQALIAKTMLLGPTNKKVSLDEDLAAKVPFGADTVARLRQIDSDPINDNIGTVVQRWNKMIAR
jgi:putative spermidine/putrescine transport system substrate-binding protein